MINKVTVVANTEGSVGGAWSGGGAGIPGGRDTNDDTGSGRFISIR